MSQLKRISEESCELEMTPMIDVTFLLLIFFICTIKFKTLEGKLSAFLPKDVGVNTSDAEPKEKTEILIKVLVEGTRLDPKDSAAKGNNLDPNVVAPWSGDLKDRYIYGSDRVLQYQLGARNTSDLDELEERLIKKYKEVDATMTGDEVPAATIDPRKNTVYADVVQVLDRAINAEYTDITFVGSYED